MTDRPDLDMVSLGDANLDILMRVPSHPVLDPDGDKGAGVRGDFYRLGAGGVAANVAVCLSRLGNRVGLVGVIGDDDPGRILMQSLQERWVDLRFLKTVPGHQTTLACCFENAAGQAVHYACLGPTHLLPRYFDPNCLNPSTILFVAGSTMTRDETTGRAMIGLLRKAHQHGNPIALDPGKFWLNPGLSDIVEEAVSMASILLPNEYEAGLLTGCSSPADSLKKLLRQGPDIVAMKRGELGCLVGNTHQIFDLPAFRTEVASSFGAGDAFNGGFLHGLEKQWPLEKTAQYALAVSCLKIQHPGTQEGLPSEDEVETFLRQQQDLTDTSFQPSGS